MVIPPLLVVVPLDRLAARLGRRARGVKHPGAADQAAIAAAVERLLGALPPPWRITCLNRSAVLFHLLKRSGVGVELCIGIRQEGTGMAAHAWLVREDVPYLERERPAYEEIARFR